MSLVKSTVRGVKWSGISQFGRQGLSFVTTAILARLLLPSDYGLVGMAFVVTGFASIFSDLGTSAALIQKKEISNELLSTVFWANVLFGLLTMLVVLAISPLAALFYHEPRVTRILQCLSISFLLGGLTTVPYTILERNMSFDTIARIELVSSGISSIIGIVSAIRGLGVWSLVFQSITNISLLMGMYWYQSKWRPAFIFSFRELKSIHSYSSNLVGFSIINYFIRNADYMLIGRYLGAQDLGYYTLAYRLMLYPLQNVTGVLRRVLFPAFSRLQDDEERFRNSYLRVNAAIAIVTLPMMFGLWAVAGHFVLYVFGQKWQPVITLLLILVPVGMVQSISSTVGFIYQAKGRTDWMFRWGIVAGVVTISAFLIGIHWGIVGVATAYSIATWILIYPLFYFPFKLINLDFSDLLRAVSNPFWCSLTMFLCIIVIKALFPVNFPHGIALLILIPAGVIVYLVSSWFINRKEFLQLYKLVLNRQ